MIADGTMARIIRSLNAHGYPTDATPPTYEELTARGVLQASVMNIEARCMMNPGWLNRAVSDGENTP